MKIALMIVGFVGALMMGAVGFSPAVGVDNSASAQTVSADGQHTLVSQSNVLGPCGEIAPEAKGRLVLGDDC